MCEVAFRLFHCGGVPGAELTNDDAIKDLLRVHAFVRSIITFCKGIGKTPVTRDSIFSMR